jgi:hypothetical protein
MVRHLLGDPIAVSGAALDTRATILTGAPTTSYMTHCL